MKLMVKNGLIAAGVLLALFSTSCASTSKEMTASQAVGAGYSPAALYRVTVSGNAKSYTTSKAREQVQTIFK